MIMTSMWRRSDRPFLPVCANPHLRSLGKTRSPGYTYHDVLHEGPITNKSLNPQSLSEAKELTAASPLVGSIPDGQVIFGCVSPNNQVR